jgi:hypothetical protein
MVSLRVLLVNERQLRDLIGRILVGRLLTLFENLIIALDLVLVSENTLGLPRKSRVVRERG